MCKYKGLICPNMSVLFKYTMSQNWLWQMYGTQQITFEQQVSSFLAVSFPLFPSLFPQSVPPTLNYSINSFLFSTFPVFGYSLFSSNTAWLALQTVILPCASVALNSSETNMTRKW